MVATLALCGDVMLGRLVDRAVRERGPAYPWGDTLPLLRSADVRLINLECVIATGGLPWPEKTFHFRAGVEAVDALRCAGIDYVSLANNHVLDFQAPALLELLDHLTRAGIAHAGAGRTLAEAARPALLEARGLRIGVVAVTDYDGEWSAEPHRPGVHHVPITLDPAGLGRVQAGVARARDAGADLVIVSAHWGPNMRPRPPAHFRAFARAVLDSGAHLFHGHSAHVFQGVEASAGRVILYDTGDFVDDYAVDPALRNDQGLLFLASVAPGRVLSLEAVPVRIGRCQVNVAREPDRTEIAERFRQLSAELGTRIADAGDRLVVEVAASRSEGERG